MNYILNGELIVVDNNLFYIYLHSDHVIIHRRESPNGFFNTKVVQYFQARIDNNIDWDEMEKDPKMNGLPTKVKEYCDSFLTCKAFW